MKSKYQWLMTGAVVTILTMAASAMAQSTGQQVIGDVVVPSASPELSRAQKLEQDRTEGCRGMQGLARDKILKLSADGKNDYAILCEGVAATDQIRWEAATRLLRGLLLLSRGSSDPEVLTKIAVNYGKVESVSTSVFFQSRGDAGAEAANDQIFSTAVAASAE